MQTLKKCTLPKFNIAPENRPSQKESSIPTIHFSGAMLVSGSVGSIHPLIGRCLMLGLLAGDADFPGKMGSQKK